MNYTQAGGRVSRSTGRCGAAIANYMALEWEVYSDRAAVSCRHRTGAYAW